MGSLINWAEGILLSLVFLTVLGLGIADLVHQYSGVSGTNVDSMSIPLMDNTTIKQFEAYRNSSQSDIQNGTVVTGGIFGINIVQSYHLLTGFVSLVWGFVSGNWLVNIAGMMQLGEGWIILARIVGIVAFLSVVALLLYAFLKVNV